MAVEVKNLPANAGDIKDTGSNPGSGRSPGEGNGNPLQYPFLENPMDRGAWWATVYGITELDLTETTEHAHILWCLTNISKGTQPKPIFCYLHSKSAHPITFPISVSGPNPWSHPWLLFLPLHTQFTSKSYQHYCQNRCRIQIILTTTLVATLLHATTPSCLDGWHSLQARSPAVALNCLCLLSKLQPKWSV